MMLSHCSYSSYRPLRHITVSRNGREYQNVHDDDDDKIKNQCIIMFHVTYTDRRTYTTWSHVDLICIIDHMTNINQSRKGVTVPPLRGWENCSFIMFITTNTYPATTAPSHGYFRNPGYVQDQPALSSRLNSLWIHRTCDRKPDFSTDIQVHIHPSSVILTRGEPMSMKNLKIWEIVPYIAGNFEI